MLKNYLTLGFRTLMQRLQFSTLNIIGLSFGMAACFVLIQLARYEGSYDAFHTKADNIYRLSLRLTTEQGVVTEVPKNFSALGPMLRRSLSEVKDYVRVFPIDGTIALRAGEKVFNEKNLIFADAGMFNVFDFAIIHGDKTTALVKPNSVVLTRSTARRYFNSEDCIGRQIMMREGALDVALAVTAVIDDVPENSHLPFDIMVSHATLLTLWGERADNSWDEALFYTYVLTNPGTDCASFIKKLAPEMLTKFTGWNQAVKLDFVVQPLREIYLTSHMVQEARVNGNAGQVTMLWIIAVIVVLLSWVNYVNLSTARYLERAKEVGVRKVIGASKVQLIVQFLAESVILTLISLITAFVIIQTTSPAITRLSGKSIPLWNDPLVLATIVGVFLLGSIVAATFPAIILSSLKITSVIKGAFKSSSSGQQMRHGLIVLQFMISSVIIGATFIVYQQLNFMRSADLGANVSTTIILPSPDITDSTYASRASFFKTQLAKHKGIEWVVSSTSIPGKQDNIVQGGLTTFEKSDEEGAMHYAFGVDRKFIPSYSMRFVGGRNFADTGDQDAVIINETAMHVLGFKTPEEAVGRDLVANWTSKATIIGVVADFHQHSLKSAIDPVVFKLDESASFGYFSVKVSASRSDIESSLRAIRSEWEQAFSGNPFDYFFLDEYYEQQYQDDVRFGKVLGVFSALALLIACLGIFGLAVFNAAQRAKEISIRKVLGASTSNILIILSANYFKLIVVALFIAVPFTYYLSANWLSSFAFRVSIAWWMLALPEGLIMAIALLTISSQSIKVAASNPTRHLG
jgi:putative ABC transport system permease protein